MSRIPFTCSKCDKQITLNEDIYNAHYKDIDLCMSCRPAEPKKEESK